MPAEASFQTSESIVKSTSARLPTRGRQKVVGLEEALARIQHKLTDAAKRAK